MASPYLVGIVPREEEDAIACLILIDVGKMRI
jgi:hypothetical protein